MQNDIKPHGFAAIIALGNYDAIGLRGTIDSGHKAAQYLALLPGPRRFVAGEIVSALHATGQGFALQRHIGLCGRRVISQCPDDALMEYLGIGEKVGLCGSE